MEGLLSGVGVLSDDEEDVVAVHNSAGVLHLGQVLAQVPGEGVTWLLR